MYAGIKRWFDIYAGDQRWPFMYVEDQGWPHMSKVTAHACLGSTIHICRGSTVAAYKSGLIFFRHLQDFRLLELDYFLISDF